MKSTRKQGFTLIELLVVISIIALLIGILLPALGAARRTARQMQSNTQVRGIHQAMVIFSQSNKTYFPGLREGGVLAAGEGVGTPTTANHGGYVEHRYGALLDGNYFTGEYALSPSETRTAWTTGEVTTANYSFAMLRISRNADTAGTAPLATVNGNRAAEWADTMNTESPVMSDRGISPTGAPADYNIVHSVHTEPDSAAASWRGSLAWNDNHVEFATSPIIDSNKYAKAEVHMDDNLFNSGVAGTGTTSSGTWSAASNAHMAYTDTTTAIVSD